MTDDDKATIAEFEIFSGKFDHWGSVTVRSGPVVECGVDECDYSERVMQVCTRTGALNEHDAEIVGTYAYQLHLSKCHLDQVIEAIGQRP